MDYQKSALNACELLQRWRGDTEIPYSDFVQVMNRAYELNQQISSGGLVVLTVKEHEELVANQKKRR